MANGKALRNRSGQAVFLCYHSVAPRGPKYLTVTAELFERQLAELRRRGLRSGGIEELAAIAAGRPVEPSVFLTFDDGFRDNHSTVMPLLREYGFGAFVFVLPPLVDSGGRLDWPEMADDLKRFPDSMRSVTWDMVGEMAEGGFEVGAHTLTHPHLPELDGERLRDELSDSRPGSRSGSAAATRSPTRSASAVLRSSRRRATAATGSRSPCRPTKARARRLR